MKIVVIGGSGLIGKNIVSRLRLNGHLTWAASPSRGVDTITSKGLDEALEGANVVVDVSNSPSFEEHAVLDFFETSSRNLITAETNAGVEHHIALSVVGADRLPDNGYMRAKIVQENLIKASKIPYTILRSTQFFEFIESIINSSISNDEIRISPALFQPVAARDVSTLLTDLAVGVPLNSIVEIGGPDRYPMDELARKFLAAGNDKRQVIADVHARYFGSEINDQSLVAGDKSHIGETRCQNWLVNHLFSSQIEHLS